MLRTDEDTSFNCKAFLLTHISINTYFPTYTYCYRAYIMSNCTTLKYVLIILLFMYIYVQRTNRAGVEFHADAVRIIAVGNTAIVLHIRFIITANSSKK